MKNSLAQLLALLRPKDKRNGLVLLAMMLVSAVLEVVGLAAVPAFVGALVDPERLGTIPFVGEDLRELGSESPKTLVVWGAAALFGIFAAKNAFLALNHYSQIRYTLNRRVELANRLMRAYMRAPYVFHLRHNTSELLRNVEHETNVIAQQIIGAVLDVATRIVVLVAILAFLLVAEPVITIFWGALFASCMLGVLLATSRQLQGHALTEQRHRSRFVQALYQAFGCIKESRVLNREALFAERFGDGLARTAHAIRYKNFLSRMIPPLTEMVAITGLLVLAVALVLLARPVESILVTMSLFVVALVRLREGFSSLLSRLTGLRYSSVSLAPVHRHLMELEREGDRQDALAPPEGEPMRLRSEIRLEDVWFRHSGADRPALQGLDLVVPARSAVALVGSTGAGKSTAVDAILGLLEPDRGAVLVDGVDIRVSGVRRWQRAIGYVPQTIYILDDTIRRNIALGVPDRDIDEAALARAIEAAQLQQFVARQPSGLETQVGENGLRVSGGERQRIGIARALYNDPSVLILDEATSSLDTVTESAVIRSVEQMRGERTIVMIAHRLTTVRNCDRLYFMRDGRVEAQGTYEELRERHRDFAQMAAE
ncbi:ABC transporter ATP-binding protein [Salinarimonas sp.]|uniref:ABC transporter ATP-binding protein n=1 Tax=Salinarimonas sp. TaxID=2766526 RepID=UPI0032D95E06